MHYLTFLFSSHNIMDLLSWPGVVFIPPSFTGHQRWRPLTGLLVSCLMLVLVWTWLTPFIKTSFWLALRANLSYLCRTLQINELGNRNGTLQEITWSHMAACVPRKSVWNIEPCKGYFFLSLFFYLVIYSFIYLSIIYLSNYLFKSSPNRK